MALPKEWVTFLRDQYPQNSRIRLRELKETDPKLSPGAVGVLEHINDMGEFLVKWDKGFQTRLTIGENYFTVLPPEPVMMKFYMPLTADVTDFDEWGTPQDENIPLLDSEILAHKNAIIAALIDNRKPEEKERGIMHWYHDSDTVNDKVQSVVFTAEARGGKLWGVAECMVIGTLTQEETDKLKEYIGGQASDGWGEGFEQRAIEDGDREIFVHLWNWNDDWSIETEAERFPPKVAEGLPEMCFSTLPITGDLICIKRGETGYYPSDWSTDDKERNVQIADDANEKLGVTPEQRQAMEVGSMAGWDVPGADPKSYEVSRPEQTGGMTLG